MNPDEPLSVSSQAISSQTTSLKIEIPEFNKDDGPIRYCIVIMDYHYYDSVLLQSLLHCGNQCIIK